MKNIIVRNLDLCDYQETWEKMKEFTSKRTPQTPDEIWLLEHNQVFTTGISSEQKDILHLSNIPIIKTDRGGKITYHGPGQLICYFLFDLKRLKISIKKFVGLIEDAIIKLLAKYKISAHTIENLPGIYVENKKICSIGLKVKKGCCYHGLALNVSNDLTPFSYINPCGNSSLSMTKVNDFAPIDIKEIRDQVLTLTDPRIFLHRYVIPRLDRGIQRIY